MKTKPTNIIQRLCLFLLLVASTTGAWATDYNRSSYSIFRSRETVEKVGKKKQVRTLHQWEVEITFSDCKTTSGTDNSAIYELAKGSKITVKADEGYSIRWIILRDTEGGKRYSDKEGSSASTGLHQAMIITSRGMPSRTRKSKNAIGMDSTTTTTTSLSTIMMLRHEASRSSPTTIPSGDSSRCATSLWGLSNCPA